MKSVLIGYPYSGKTLFFDSISEIVSNDHQKISSNIRNIKVYDDRLHKLNEFFQPKKFSPAEINLLDNHVTVQEFNKNKSLFTQQTQKNILNSEVTVIVARCFGIDKAQYFKEHVKPYEDLKNLIEEICFLDLIAAEKKFERIKKENKSGVELHTVEKCYQHLQDNKPVFQLNLKEEEILHLSGFKFLTQNKIMVVLNTDDSFLDDNEYTKIKNMLDEFDIPFMKINTEIESEISQLETEQDKLEFLDEYGLTEIISKRFVKKLYDMMGLVSFFTVGKDEVKAWSIKTGTSALKAAGKIHSDIERGFIRAEIIGSDKFFEFDGDMNKLKKEGLVRLEGKDYIVKDGEIINFRFNV